MKVGITALAYSLPKNKITNSDLAQRFGGAYINKILPTTGILERRSAGKDECASDFAINAAEKIFAMGVERQSIDLLVFGTQMPDYQMPTTACIIQNKLGLPTSCAAFDVNLGCSQFVYGLGIANAWIKSGMAKRALVLAGDTPTRVLNPKDNVVAPLFGDGAAAAIVEEVSEGGFKEFDFGTDGRGWKDLIRRTSGLREPPSPETAVEKADKSGAVRSLDDMFMDGGNIFLFAINSVPISVRKVLGKSGMSIGDINLFVFHQASELIIRSFAKLLKIPSEKMHFKLHDVGNTGGSTVGITLADAIMNGKVNPGDKVLLSAFGVGLSWGSCVLEWSPDFIGASSDADFKDSPPKPQSQICGGK